MRKKYLKSFCLIISLKSRDKYLANQKTLNIYVLLFTTTDKGATKFYLVLKRKKVNCLYFTELPITKKKFK